MLCKPLNIYKRSLGNEEDIAGCFWYTQKAKPKVTKVLEKNHFLRRKKATRKEEVWKSFCPAPIVSKKNNHTKICLFRRIIKCSACNQFGHMEKVLKLKQTNRHNKLNLLRIKNKLNNIYLNNKEVWLIDISCTNHMTHNAYSRNWTSLTSPKSPLATKKYALMSKENELLLLLIMSLRSDDVYVDNVIEMRCCWCW